MPATTETAEDHASIRLTLTNRDDVIAFINGEFHPARAPKDLGSDVVLVDLIDRIAVVVLGETVTRADGEFRIGRGETVRDRFPYIP